MLDWFKEAYNAWFSDPRAFSLMFFIVAISLLLYFSGHFIVPILIALVFSFVLDWLVVLLQKAGFSRKVSLTLVLLNTTAMASFLIYYIIPDLWHQSLLLLSDLPSILSSFYIYLREFSANYPSILSLEQLESLTSDLHELFNSQHLIDLGRSIMTLSLNMVIFCVYVFLIPLLIFFFLKDKEELKKTIMQVFPEDRELINKVCSETNTHLLNYIRGKMIEVVIVSSVTFIFFILMDLRYAELLAIVTGFSVLIPYIGATLVTLPIAMVAFFQFGWSTHFTTVMLGYLAIQILDGNLLVPLLFAELVQLHPVIIIAAILVFGGLWGTVGVFFAIPLALFLRTVWQAWPREAKVESSVSKN
jgi:putative permease